MTVETFKSQVLPLKNKLFRYAKSILKDYDLARDVVQETLIKVWEKRIEMSEIKNREAWCMTLTRNFALDKLRSGFHKRMTPALREDYPVMEPSPLKLAEEANAMEIIDSIVSNLPLKQKESFLLRDVEGYSYQEISEITGHSISDVKVCIFRARNTIREKLTKLHAYGLEKA